MKRCYFLTILSIFSLFFCSELSANVIFPLAFQMRLGFWFSGLVFFSLFIEYLIMRYFLPKTITSERVAWVTVLMNAISGVAGAAFGLLYEDDLIRNILLRIDPPLQGSVFAAIYFLLLFIITVCLNVLIELPVALYFFSPVKKTKLVKYLFMVNMISVALGIFIILMRVDVPKYFGYKN